MNLKEFKQNMEAMTHDMAEFIEDHMTHESDKCEGCQKICFLNTLSEIDRMINGTTQSDLLE